MRACGIAVALAILAGQGLAASQHTGHVTFGTLPVPGATVTASRDQHQLVTITDQQGVYRLPDLTDGVWTIRIEMLGFSTLTQDITVATDSPPSMWELTLLPFDTIAGGLPLRPVETASPANPPIATRRTS